MSFLLFDEEFENVLLTDILKLFEDSKEGFEYEFNPFFELFSS